ncbi:MAG: hypothetical protein IKA74_08115 [Clostridia bacterium]|nr:hypothetical protein [Clostridia bacterium]
MKLSGSVNPIYTDKSVWKDPKRLLFCWLAETNIPIQCYSARRFKLDTDYYVLKSGKKFYFMEEPTVTRQYSPVVHTEFDGNGKRIERVYYEYIEICSRDMDGKRRFDIFLLADALEIQREFYEHPPKSIKKESI